MRGRMGEGGMGGEGRGEKVRFSMIILFLPGNGDRGYDDT